MTCMLTSDIVSVADSISPSRYVATSPDGKHFASAILYLVTWKSSVVSGGDCKEIERMWGKG
jgi:hypothetical protein